VKQAHPLEAVVEAGWAPSTHYLIVRLRRGEIRGRKVGRHWRMSDEDIQAYVESLANKSAPTLEESYRSGGLSLASSRRRSA
jgi:excisionase family DNA binding protein